MNENLKIVIGAGYGDEGKGRTVAYFAKPYGDKALVILPNGSAQRAHTVVDGAKRHVFHHFGSGTLSGAHTFCSQNYVVNPVVFHREYEELEALGVPPTVYVHKCCEVATPWDALINQVWETSLGDNRYGSCGLGVYETKQRSYRSLILPEKNYYITANCLDKWSERDLVNMLTKIQSEYMPERIKEVLDGKPIPEEYIPVLEKDFVSSFLEDIHFFLDHVKIVSDDEELPVYDMIIFECGQGLAIQQYNETFHENVTPSNTGIINPLLDIRNFRLEKHLKEKMKIEVVYVTRCYTTRHGAGVLPHECEAKDISKFVEDKTNVHNPWQQSLRYAPLDMDYLFGRIIRDVTDAREMDYTVADINYHFAITCLDHIDNTIPVFINGIRNNLDYSTFRETFYCYAEAFMPLNEWTMYCSYGEDISKTYEVE